MSNLTYSQKISMIENLVAAYWDDANSHEEALEEFRKDINCVLKVKHDDDGFISTNEVVEIRNELNNLIGSWE